MFGYGRKEKQGTSEGKAATMKQDLIILGASVRAAAFSALRANLRPWCIDLFGDADLCARCPTKTIAPQDYPAGFVDMIREAPAVPWIFTGALENRPRLIRRLAGLRPLWGNDPSVLARARSPRRVQKLLRAAGLPCPALSIDGAAGLPPGRWLAKPRRGAGGKGIRPWNGQPAQPRGGQRVYYQEYIEGEACAAIYASERTATHLLGVTRQLVGERWLHAATFHYCGSVGPLALTPSLRGHFERLGTILAQGCGLRGLFGIDCVMRDGIPWPVEINPRYTASVEVLEYALGFSALGWQRVAFERTATEPPPIPANHSSGCIGKAILFAKSALIFPAKGPWLETVQSPGSVHVVPAFADIPAAGQEMAAGRPILTFFARGNSPDACFDSLQQTAADLDRRLFGDIQA